MFLYVALIVWLFYKVQFWNASLIKDTVLWLFTSAFILLMDIDKVNKNEYHFRKLLFDNLKLILVLEFIINLYTFSLWIEMILMPSLTIIFVMDAIAGLKEEHLPVKKLSEFILMIFGTCLIVFTIYKTYNDYQNLVIIDILRAFLLPPLLTFAYMPFLYLVALFMAYETLFMRLNWLLSPNKSIAKHAKRKIFATCLINLNKLNTFAKEDARKFMESTSEADVLNIIKEFKKRQKTQT